MAIERDRDARGRARNARPARRARSAVAARVECGSERVPDELHMSVDDTVALAQSYLDSGRPFHAHEVLEALWKTQPTSERDLWQGLAQIAVGFTHAMRGNIGGATTLLRRGAGRVANYVGDTHGIDVVGVLSWAEALADLPGAEPPPLALR